MSSSSLSKVDVLLQHLSKGSESSYAASSLATDSDSVVREAMAKSKVKSAIGLDDFAKKNFTNNAFSNAKSWLDFDMDDFTAKCNAFLNEGNSLVAGYAPFCKHLFIPTAYLPMECKDTMLRITVENVGYLRSGYVRRRESELPYLTRWFQESALIAAGSELPMASYLDVIVYSREQVLKEHLAMSGDLVDFPHQWAIVSVKTLGEASERPMEPITAMRNALPLEHGGSGTALRKEDFLKAVEYWDTHAPIQ